MTVRSSFTVIVDDDGPGLTETERARVVTRGQRLDESKPGSGLGLSIVADLAHLYKGRFALEPSPQGGLRARLELARGLDLQRFPGPNLKMARIVIC